MAVTPKLGLTQLDEGQAGGEVLFNEAIRRLENLAGGITFQEVGKNAPGTQTEGFTYVVGAAGSGDWAGHDNEIAMYEDGGWIFLTPKAGMIGWDVSTTPDTLRIYDGSNWLGGTQVSDLNQTITTGGSDGYTASEVQTLSDKVDELLDALQALGIVKP